jgi:hypothetical protein
MVYWRLTRRAAMIQFDDRGLLINFYQIYQGLDATNITDDVRLASPESGIIWRTGDLNLNSRLLAGSRHMKQGRLCSPPVGGVGQYLIVRFRRFYNSPNI